MIKRSGRMLLPLSAGLIAACGGLPGSIDKSTPATQATPLTKLYDWRGEPAMVSNHGVYRAHEFIYQDYIHDDHGPNTDGISHLDLPFGVAGPYLAAPTDLRLSPAPTLNFAGDYAYAVNGMHMENVADLIEMRVAMDADNVYYRFTMGDMNRLGVQNTAIGICVDEDRSVSTGSGVWPFDADLADDLGCDRFYTIGQGPYSVGAWVTQNGQSTPLADLGGEAIDNEEDATIEMRVPRAVADPGAGTWRMIVGAGLWNAPLQNWRNPTLLPTAVPLAPLPSGGKPGAPNVWDLLSNNGEPNSVWMEEKQANDLIVENISNDFVDVDFARMAQDRDDADPQLTGVVQRIYRSQYAMGDSEDTARGRDVSLDLGVHYVYRGPWQPYVAVIPDNYYDDPARTWPFDLCMHPLGANHNVEVYYSEAFARPDYNPLVTGVIPATGNLGNSEIRGLINRLQGVYACTLGRGEGEGYQGGDGMVDTLEVQADMLKRYRVDMERRTVHGVSLGAIGTWHLTTLYPDQYAAAMPYIFTTDVTGGLGDNPELANLYNLPVFFSIGTLDEFTQGLQGDFIADQLEGNGNEYVYLHYLGRQHEGRIENDFLPFAEALAYTRKRVRDPARVRYVLDPSRFSPKLPPSGAVYWVGGMQLRDAAASGSVDAVSLARADELPRHQVVFDGLSLNQRKTYVGRFRGLLRMTEDEFRAFWQPGNWEPGWTQLSLSVTPADLPVEENANGFRLSASNLSALALEPARMKLAPGEVKYSVTTDGPLTISIGKVRLSFDAAGTHEGSVQMPGG